MALLLVTVNIKHFKQRIVSTFLKAQSCRNIINTVYDVVTPADGKHWGVCSRNLIDMLHAWQIQSDSGIEMELMEESPTLAFLPRFITNHVHHPYRLMHKEELIAEFCLQGHPFVFKLNVHLVSQKAISISPLILASAILISDISHRYRN